ncbi:hypothetical protein BDK51DRAFT_32532, partial [Blyttiomyces helicus]
SHPIIQKMLSKVQSGDASAIASSAYVLFESTALASGFNVRDPASFAATVQKVVRADLGVPLDAKADVTIIPAPEVEQVKTEDPAVTESDEDEVKPVEHDEL